MVTQAERVVTGGKTVARVRITEAGRRALAKIRMNRHRCITGTVLLCLLLAMILALAFAHAWAPPTTIGGTVHVASTISSIPNFQCGSAAP
jgi:hypothetical protein